MNIYEITKRDLRDRNFAFKDETEFLGKDFENQYFIFDGLLFYICISGTAKIKINYKEYQVTADDMFIIPPKHICSIYGCSPGFKVRLILISLDFLCSMPVTPNFDLFQKADMHPHIHLDSVQLDNMLKLHSVITHYDSDNELSRQIQDTLIHAAIHFFYERDIICREDSVVADVGEKQSVKKQDYQNAQKKSHIRILNRDIRI